MITWPVKGANPFPCILLRALPSILVIGLLGASAFYGSLGVTSRVLACFFKLKILLDPLFVALFGILAWNGQLM